MEWWSWNGWPQMFYLFQGDSDAIPGSWSSEISNQWISKLWWKWELLSDSPDPGCRSVSNIVWEINRSSCRKELFDSFSNSCFRFVYCVFANSMVVSCWDPLIWYLHQFSIDLVTHIWPYLNNTTLILNYKSKGWK